MKDYNTFDLSYDIPDQEAEKTNSQEYYKKIHTELKKISNEDVIGNSFKALYLVEIIIDKECDCNKEEPPIYRLYVNGTDDENLQVMINKAIKKFIENKDYFFNYVYDQLQQELARVIEEYLNNNSKKNEYWCKLILAGKNLISYKDGYKFVILRFDKISLGKNITYKKKRHPFLDHFKDEWLFDKLNDLDGRKINYNEIFRRAANRVEYFLYLYGDVFNTLSTLKYESGQNYGSILALCETSEKRFGEIESNYDVSIKFKYSIKIDNTSYKRIRKLLEISNDKLSLLMNENGEIYAIGKIINNPSCEYYKIYFDGFSKWTLYKNEDKFLCFENMLPKLPDKENGIDKKNNELLKMTFGIKSTSKLKKIIQEAVSQKHGTIVVFAENAKDEAERLKESGISIEPIDISTGKLVGEITSIDGAIICDISGICYLIGVILDGESSKKTDLSRGARYNSAIRYIEKQKNIHKKTFVVVVSEDGYVDCFSSEQ